MARKPAFQIKEVKNRKLEENVAVIVKGADGSSRLETKKVTRTIPVSYMVYFPHKHSLWFETKDQMHQAGITTEYDVDTDTGLAIPKNAPIDLEALVNGSTQAVA